MPRCLLALGSNLGDRHAILERACAELTALPDCQLLARSTWHTTPPIGGAANQGAFLNGAVLLETTIKPQPLATALQAIETQLGRQRVVRWDARTLDIDMLLYDTKILNTPKLTIPHPRMTFRSFVMQPAAEIAGSMLHPTTGWTLARLLEHLQTAPRYLVITAAEKQLAEWLAAQLCKTFDAPVYNRKHPLRQQIPAPSPGSPPLVATFSPGELATLDDPRPALVIALDPPDPQQLQKAAANAGFEADSKPNPDSPNWLQQSGLGPLARITAEDPATVLQEALAAVRCAWSDIEATKKT